MDTVARIKRLREDYPDFEVLTPSQEALEHLLAKLTFLLEDEVILTVEKIPQGNMNLTLRVRTNFRLLIVKQARPWVEKYPQIDAPSKRASYEAYFYHAVKKTLSVRSRMPELLFFSEEHQLLIFSDLFDATDLSQIYEEGKLLSQDQMDAATDWLISLHAIPVTSTSHDNNLAMRQLNHEHIFDFPFRVENGFDLDQIQPGLSKIADRVKEDRALVKEISRLGKQYYLYPKEKVLLHGDFFLGSMLVKDEQLFVIDPEFMFCGEREWDLAVYVAHLLLSGHGKHQAQDVISFYGIVHHIDQELVFALAGVEMLRRLLGVAQLPIRSSLNQKSALVEQAVEFILRR